MKILISLSAKITPLTIMSKIRSYIMNEPVDFSKVGGLCYMKVAEKAKQLGIEGKLVGYTIVILGSPNTQDPVHGILLDPRGKVVVDSNPFGKFDGKSYTYQHMNIKGKTHKLAKPITLKPVLKRTVSSEYMNYVERTERFFN